MPAVFLQRVCVLFGVVRMLFCVAIIMCNMVDNMEVKYFVIEFLQKRTQTRASRQHAFAFLFLCWLRAARCGVGQWGHKAASVFCAIMHGKYVFGPNGGRDVAS